MTIQLDMNKDKNSKLTASFINSKGILFESDCLSAMKGMKENSLDCIFADPPFNLNKIYSDTKYDDNMDEHKYELWVQEWLFECIRVLKPGGSLFVYHVPSFLIKVATYINTFPNMLFRNWIALNMKSGFPIRNRMHPAHYGLLYYVKNGEKFTFNVVRSRTPVCRHCGGLIKDYGGYRGKFKKWEDEDGIPWTQISDYWDDTRPARQYDKKRKFQINELPYGIPERAILMSTNPGDIVFDPFGGSGSTYKAAQINDRHWVGTEVGDTIIIVSRLFELDYIFNSNPPKKLVEIFNSNGKTKINLTKKRQQELASISKRVKKEIESLPVKKNGRYSHRMTNKIFES